MVRNQITKNFGTFKAIFVGPNPPTNTDLLWKDSLNGGIFKYYNTNSKFWEAIEAVSSEKIGEVISHYNPGATVGDGQSTGILVTSKYTQYIRVIVSGYFAIIGDGDKTKDCYFSSDGGITAKNLINIVREDELFWNGEIAKVDLINEDKVTIYIL